VIDVKVDRSALCTPDGHGGNSYVRTRCLRLADGSSGLAMSTVKRRLSSVTGLDDYLIALGEPGTKRPTTEAGSPSSYLVCSLRRDQPGALAKRVVTYSAQRTTAVIARHSLRRLSTVTTMREPSGVAVHAVDIA
jgi:hypothetical protein